MPSHPIRWTHWAWSDPFKIWPSASWVISAFAQKGEKDADQCIDAGYRRPLWTKILSPKETRFSLPKGDYFSVGSPNTTHQKVSFPSGVQATPMPISS